VTGYSGEKTKLGLGTRASGKAAKWSGWFFEVSVLGNPSPLFRGKLYALFFAEGCQRPGYSVGFLARGELLSDEFLKRGGRLFRAASSAHDESIVT